MRPLPAFLVCVFLLMWAPSCLAVQKFGLISFDGLDQTVTLGYRYDNNNSSSQEADEEYRLRTGYSLYNPLFLRGALTGGIRFDQLRNSTSGQSQEGSSNTFGFTYGASGVLLERSAYPVSFSVQSDISEEPREFGKTYQITTDSRSVGITMANTLLPVSVTYTNSTSRTDGLAQDRVETHDRMNIFATNMLPRSSTTLGLSYSGDDSSGGDSSSSQRSYGASLMNGLTLGSETAGGKLDSNYNIQQDTGAFASQTKQVSEYLNWRFGKALTSGLSYLLVDLKNTSGSTTSHTGSFWLQHTLFNSFTTRLELGASKKFLTGGTESGLSGGLSASYAKKLPKNSRLMLGAYGRYLRTDRSLAGSTNEVVDEGHKTVLGDAIFLANSNVIQSTISVRNSNSQTRSTPYTLGVDYEIVQFGTLTELLVFITGSEIKDGDNLLVSYSYEVNNDISYATISSGASADVSLFEDKYHIQASLDHSEQDLISGSADALSLQNTNTYHLSFIGTVDPVAYNIDYQKTVSTTSRNQSIGGVLRYSTWAGQGLLTLFASERYAEYTETALASASSSSTQNIVTLTSGYRRMFPGSVMMNLSSRYTNTTGNTSKDDLSFLLDLRWQRSKLMVSLISQVNLSGLGRSDMATDEHVTLTLTRHF